MRSPGYINGRDHAPDVRSAPGAAITSGRDYPGDFEEPAGDSLFIETLDSGFQGHFHPYYTATLAGVATAGAYQRGAMGGGNFGDGLGRAGRRRWDRLADAAKTFWVIGGRACFIVGIIVFLGVSLINYARGGGAELTVAMPKGDAFTVVQVLHWTIVDR